jgi:hypothetical protein
MAVSNRCQHYHVLDSSTESTQNEKKQRLDMLDQCNDLDVYGISFTSLEQQEKNCHHVQANTFVSTGKNNNYTKRIQIQNSFVHFPSRKMLPQVVAIFVIFLFDHAVRGFPTDYKYDDTISVQTGTAEYRNLLIDRRRLKRTEGIDTSSNLEIVIKNNRKMKKLMQRRQQTTNGMQQMNHNNPPVKQPVRMPQAGSPDDDFSIIDIIATKSDFPTTSPTISDVPSINPTITYAPSSSVSLGSFRPTRTPTEQPSQKPTQIPTKTPTSQPSSEPSVKPSKYPTSVPSVAPSELPSLDPTTKRLETKLSLLNFTIQLRTEAGSPAVNASSVSSVLALYMETEMMFSNLLSIRLRPTNEFSIVLSGIRGNDIKVTDIDFDNNVAVFSGIDTQVTGLLNEQNFLLRDTMGIQKYFDRAEGAFLGNDNVTVIACFFDTNTTNRTNATTNSSSPTSDVDRKEPVQNTKKAQSSSISSFLQSPLGVWAIVAVSLSIAAFLFVLGVAIIKATRAHHESNNAKGREIDNNVTANQDDEDDDFDEENIGVVVINKENDDNSSDDDEQNNIVNRNQRKVDQHLQSMITVCKTETSTRPSSTSFDDTDYDNIDYGFSYDMNDNDDDDNSYSPIRLGIVAATSHHGLFDLDEINSVSSTSTACGNVDDADGIDDNENNILPKKQTTMQNLMVKRNLLPPMGTGASSDPTPMQQQQRSDTVTTATTSQSPNPVQGSASSLLPPRPKTSSTSSYFRQKLQQQSQSQQQLQRRQQQSQQQQHQRIQESGTIESTKAWRQDASVVSELSNDENDFKYDDFDDNSYSTSDIYTTAGGTQ